MLTMLTVMLMMIDTVDWPLSKGRGLRDPDLFLPKHAVLIVARTLGRK